MKKETFQGLLCCLAGLTMAAITFAFVFRTFRLPSGEILMYLVVPVLLIAEGLGLFWYVPKHGVMLQLIKRGNKSARHLYTLEISAVSAMIVLGAGLLMRGFHIPGSATVLMVGAVCISVSSVLAGFVGASMFKK